MPDLITPTEYKASQGITNTSLDGRLAALIPAASAAIKAYAQRNFGDPLVSGTKTYDYDGSGFVEIDDASAVTSVTIQSSVLPPTAYRLEPVEGPVFTWITLAWRAPVWPPVSPQMGFEYNLDNLWPFLTLPPQVTVAGTFGWATIPADVKQAAIWTIEAWLVERPGNDLAGESIAAFSQQFSFQNTPDDQDAIPARAKSLLDPYQRQVVI